MSSRCVAVVAVVMTSPSGSANMAEQMLRRDEEFRVVLTVDESGDSVYSSWCLTAIMLIRLQPPVDGGCRCQALSIIVKRR